MNFQSSLLLGSLFFAACSRPEADVSVPDRALGGALEPAVWPPLAPQGTGGAGEIDNPWLRPSQGETGGSAAVTPDATESSGGTGGPLAVGGEPPATGGALELPPELGTGGGLVPEVPPPDVRLVRYVESSSADKQVWLENRGPAILSEECELVIYSNGGTKPYRRHPIMALSAGQLARLCTTSVTAGCEMSLGSSSFNGNDALVLSCRGEVTDSFGRLGEDPGKAWQGPGVSSTDSSLVRCGTDRDTVPSDPFIIERDWATAAADLNLAEAQQSCAPPSWGGAPN